MKPTENRRVTLKHLALALALGVGLGAGSAQAQSIVDVGGAGPPVGTTTLTAVSNVAKLPDFYAGYWTADGGGDGDGSIYARLNSPTLTVLNAGDVTLTFKHRYFFEDNWDGGTVYISVDGGTSFTHVPLEAFSQSPYDKVLAASSQGGPFPALEDVFTGMSTGYDTTPDPALLTSIVNLGNFAVNDTIVVQFCGGWDWGYTEAAPNWEIETVTVTDFTAAVMLDVDFFDGQSGFTDDSDAGLAGPWVHGLRRATCRFELDAVADTADQYASDTPGSMIDLNDAIISVEVLNGELQVGDTFTLFDLSNGVTLTGAYSSLSLPAGTWDVTNFTTTGTIELLLLPSLIEETFDYTAGNLNGKDGGNGFAGPWATRRSTNEVIAVNNFWGSLGTAGGRAYPPGAWSYIEREIGTTLSDAGLMANGSTVWFSYVMDTLNQNMTNLDFNFALCSDGFYWDGTNDSYPDRTNLASGEGIGVSNYRPDIKGAIWQDTDADTIAEVTQAATTLTLHATDKPRALIVGKIEWGATDTDPEKLTLYAPDLDLNLGTPILDAWETPALDQSLFDQISIEWKDSQPSIDEIRFGATSSEVLPPDVVGPTLVSTIPANAEPNASGVYFVATFNEPISIGTGNITITDTAGPTTLTTIPVTDAAQVAVSADGFSLVITPTAVPTPGNTYYLEMASGTVTDYTGNPFAGISGSATWSFTASNTAPTVVSIDGTPAVSPIYGQPMIRYTVTFDKFYMDDATVSDVDFTNPGGASISVGTVTRVSDPLDPAVYTFDVTTSSFGTVKLQVATTVADLLGNALAAPVNDDDIYTLDAGPEPAKGTISVVNYAEGQDVGGTGDKTLVAGFDASGADKLVVVVGGEHGFSGNIGGKFYSMTFGGTEMTLVVQEEEGIPTAAIFYLDDPAATGDIVVNQDNHNGTIFGVYALSGTTPGVGAANKSTTNGVDLITATSNSLVIAGVLNAGPNGGNGATNMTTVPPLIEDTQSDLESGNRWVSMSYGSATIASPTFGTYSFSGANATDLLATVAVEIQAAEPPVTDYDTWADLYPEADLTDPDADYDGDGVSNDVERVFGLDPTDPASLNPISVPLDAAAGTLSFTRRDDALTGLFSSVETSTDLVMWTKDSGAVLVPGTPVDDVETVAVTLSPGLLSAPKLFVRVVQDDGTILSENFESGEGGFTPADPNLGTGTEWAWGAPNSPSLGGGEVTEGNGGSTKCWGTNLTGGYIAGTDASLRSPVIDLTSVAGAELSFALSLDAASGHTYEVNVIGETSDAVVANVIPATEDDNINVSPWNSMTGITIPGAAIGLKVRLEWRFKGATGNGDFNGAYIDDVAVVQTMP